MSAEASTPLVMASLSFRVQPQNQAEVLSIFNTIAERMRRAPGCCRTRLMTDVDDPNAFTLVSEWPNLENAEAFLEWRELRVIRGIRILLRGEPVVLVDEVSNRVTRMLGAD